MSSSGLLCSSSSIWYTPESPKMSVDDSHKYLFKYKLRTEKAKFQQLDSESECGYALFTPEDLEIKAGTRIAIDAGVSIFLPQGFRAVTAPITSMKNDILDCATRVISYCQWTDVEVILINNTDKTIKLKAEEQVAQLLISQCMMFAKIE